MHRVWLASSIEFPGRWTGFTRDPDYSRAGLQMMGYWIIQTGRYRYS